MLETQNVQLVCLGFPRDRFWSLADSPVRTKPTGCRLCSTMPPVCNAMLAMLHCYHYQAVYVADAEHRREYLYYFVTVH